MQQVEFFKDGGYFFANGGFRQASAVDSGAYRTDDDILVEVADLQVGVGDCLPTVFAAPLHQQVVVLVLRHDRRHAFYPLVSPAFICERTHIALFLSI